VTTSGVGAVPPRRIGGSGLIVGPIGFNAASFATGCGSFDASEATAILAELLSRPASLIDATDRSAAREVEILVGRAVRGRRDKVLLASRGDARPTDLVRGCDATLHRIGTDHIDLYYLDRVDARVPIEDSMGALAALVGTGKIRHVGVSNVDAEQLRRAHAVHPVAVVAADYSLLARSAEAGILSTARALGVGLAAYRPLSSGLLTGLIVSLDQLPRGDYRRTDPRFQPENFARAHATVRAVARLATQRQVSVARLAIAWLLAQGSDVVPLPGTRNLTHLEMNLSATDIQLTVADQAQLTSLVLDGGAGSSTPRSGFEATA
jgi:aryl-alcohol dehydrogenase-like predicted oxidoreductase